MNEMWSYELGWYIVNLKLGGQYHQQLQSLALTYSGLGFPGNIQRMAKDK